MSLCHDCGKTLASVTGLRRHRNSQHLRGQWHSCECGRRFLDPAGRSRCRRGHLKTFGCPIVDCPYRSSRKDSVKEHIKRRHGRFVPLQVLPVELQLGPSGSQPSSASPESNVSPPHLELAITAPCIFQPHPDAIHASLFHPDLYYSESSPSSTWGQSG